LARKISRLNSDFRCDKIGFPDNGLFMPESTKEPFLDLPEEQTASPEMLDSQVQRAQEQLLQLKRQQELIEKQKRELEELSRKQEELEKGRSEMIEKLSRSLVVIERETYEAEKRVEQLKATNTSFADHLEALEKINPKTWSNADLHKELSKALSAVDEARAEYTKSLTKINAKADSEVIDPSPVVEETYYPSSEDAGFLVWLKRGFAFTLPLLILGLSALLVFYFIHG
jgi:type I site-specific restriction endonuclease